MVNIPVPLSVWVGVLQRIPPNICRTIRQKPGCCHAYDIHQCYLRLDFWKSNHSYNDSNYSRRNETFMSICGLQLLFRKKRLVQQHKSGVLSHLSHVFILISHIFRFFLHCDPIRSKHRDTLSISGLFPAFKSTMSRLFPVHLILKHMSIYWVQGTFE